MSAQAAPVSRAGGAGRRRLLYVVNEGYFFLSHRRELALAAAAAGMEVHLAAPDDHVWAPKSFSNDAFKALGITFHPVPVSRRGTNLLQDGVTLMALSALYRRLRPDVIHHLTIKPNLYGGLAARLTGMPAVVSAVTGLGQVFRGRDARSRLIRAAVAPLLRLALGHRNGRIILQNPDDLERIVTSGIARRERCTLIRGSGVDLQRFRPQPEPPGDRPLVVLPARLIWEKGLADFVDAAARLEADGPPARFALVGDTQPSNPRSVPAAQLERWQAERGVEWWGRREDMPAVLAEAAIVCLPSGYGEGVPKVLLEAAASGRPVVTTDHPGCREAVEHDVTGLLVPVGDPAALAAALARLLADPGLRQRFGAAGRAKMAREFDVNQVVRKTLDVYEAVMQQAGPARRRQS